MTELIWIEIKREGKTLSLGANKDRLLVTIEDSGESESIYLNLEKVQQLIDFLKIHYPEMFNVD